MAEPLRLLVDSSVWTSNYLGSDPHFESSYEFFRTARGHGAQLLYGASKLEGMFVTLEGGLCDALRARGEADDAAAAVARAFAWGCVDNIRELGTAVGMDEADLWLACRSRQLGLDLATGTILAAAERARADYLVTWDERVLHAGTVRATTPQQMSAILAVGC